MTRNITLKYLQSCDGPYAVIKNIYKCCSRSNKYHFRNEMPYSAISAICVRIMVILLKTFIMEEKLMNYPVGKVIDIAYENSNILLLIFEKVHSIIA